MSNIVAQPEFNQEQLALIKATVAKDATDNELKLFLYRCKNMSLDPLKPGQVHFVKYGSNPGSIVVGIDGIRLRAARTGKHNGTERGVSYDENGKLFKGWARVHHKDMDIPIYEEALLSEYDTNRAQWAKMKETMIKKVAEAAALRIAFPDELGGIFVEEELSQAGTREVRAKEIQTVIDAETEAPAFEAAEYFEPPPETEAELGPGDYQLRIGKDLKGKRLLEVGTKRLKELVAWYDTNAADAPKTHPDVHGDMHEVKAYLAFLERPANS